MENNIKKKIMNEKIEKTDREINEMVFKLYGVSKKEIKMET